MHALVSRPRRKRRTDPGPSQEYEKLLEDLAAETGLKADQVKHWAVARRKKHKIDIAQSNAHDSSLQTVVTEPNQLTGHAEGL